MSSLSGLNKHQIGAMSVWFSLYDIVRKEANQSTWENHISAMYTLADTLGCPLVAAYRRWGNNATANANGLVGADNVHPNATAQADLGQLAWRGISAALTG